MVNKKIDPLLALHALVEARCMLWLHGQFNDDVDEFVMPLYAFSRTHKLGLSFDQVDDLVFAELSRQQSHGYQTANQ